MCLQAISGRPAATPFTGQGIPTLPHDGGRSAHRRLVERVVHLVHQVPLGLIPWGETSALTTPQQSRQIGGDHATTRILLALDVPALPVSRRPSSLDGAPYGPVDPLHLIHEQARDPDGSGRTTQHEPLSDQPRFREDRCSDERRQATPSPIAQFPRPPDNPSSVLPPGPACAWFEAMSEPDLPDPNGVVRARGLAQVRGGRLMALDLWLRQDPIRMPLRFSFQAGRMTMGLKPPGNRVSLRSSAYAHFASVRLRLRVRSAPGEGGENLGRDPGRQAHLGLPGKSRQGRRCTLRISGRLRDGDESTTRLHP